MKLNKQNLVSYLIALTVFSGIAAAGWFYVGSLLRRPTSLKTSDVLMSISTPSSYDQPLIIKLAGQILSISPLGASAAEAQTTGNNIVKYINAYSNTDIIQTKSANKIKEDIILKQPGHPAEFTYQIDLAKYDFIKDDQGNYTFYIKGKKGDELYRRFTIPAPFMIDADGKKSSTAEVQSDLTSDGKLIITPSKDWLSRAKYPVILDPTVEINIINVHSHPAQGQNWTIEFTTVGTADLKIIPNDQATIDDDEFTGLSCGQQKMEPQILAGDVIYYPNWSCAEIATVVHYTKKAGNHTLRFEFGGQVAYGYNSSSQLYNLQGKFIFSGKYGFVRGPSDCGTITDADGNSYNTVVIGTQCWMAKNMMTTKYPDGSNITRGPTGATWDTTDHAYYAYPPNIGNTAEETLANIRLNRLGFVYQWSAAMKGSTSESAQGICPAGWHIPTNAEWQTLGNYLWDKVTGTCGSGCSPAGTKLKTDISIGFLAPLPGYRFNDGSFQARTSDGYFWSSTKDPDIAGISYFRQLPSGATFVGNETVNPVGNTVRCLQN